MMYLVPEVKAKINEFVTKYPLPLTTTEDSQNWTHKLCQQLKFSFPNYGWGHKFAGPGRPHSSDVICILSPFIGWDIIMNSGSSIAVLTLTNESIDLTGQIFEPVSDFNWLEDIVIPPVPGTIDEKLDRILVLIEQYHEEEMEAITSDRITRIV